MMAAYLSCKRTQGGPSRVFATPNPITETERLRVADRVKSGKMGQLVVLTCGAGYR